MMSERENSGLSVVLPTYNEVDNIGAMLDALSGLYPEHRLLVLDDNSPDGTAGAARRAAQDRPMVSVIERDPEDRGLSASIFEGIARCDTPFFVVMDADFQHPPASVADLHAALMDGADLAIGARVDRRSLSPGRRLASFAAQMLTRFYLWLHGRPTSRDIMTGFFGGRTEMMQAVLESSADDMDRRGFKALFDLMKNLPSDTKVAEVGFEFGSRSAGESKISSVVILSILGQCGSVGRRASSILCKTVELLYPRSDY